MERKNILMISVSILGMMLFIFFEFFRKESGERGPDTDQFMNPSQLDNSVSKRAVYAKQRKRERQEFNFDRKVNSLEHFLDNPVDKDPFTSTEIDTAFIQEPAPISRNDDRNITKQKTAPVRIIKENPNQEASIDILQSEAESDEPMHQRKVGFASGGNDPNTKKSDEILDVNILAVFHEHIKVKHGSNVLLRLLDSFSIEGVSVPKNTFVVGKVNISNNHIYIDVRYVSVNGQLLFAGFSAYDLNGSKGIFMGNDTKIKTDALVSTMSEVQKNVNVPLLRNVPFRTAKKKIREVEISFVAGFKVYLRSQ